MYPFLYFTQYNGLSPTGHRAGGTFFFFPVCLVGCIAICPGTLVSQLPIHGVVVSRTWTWASFLWKSLPWRWFWYISNRDIWIRWSIWLKLMHIQTQHLRVTPMSIVPIFLCTAVNNSALSVSLFCLVILWVVCLRLIPWDTEHFAHRVHTLSWDLQEPLLLQK